MGGSLTAQPNLKSRRQRLGDLISPGRMAGITSGSLLGSLARRQSGTVPHPQPLPPPRRFEGRSVVVTGAGTGFGAEIAVRAAAEGARAVGIHYRSSAAGAESTAERVRAEGAEAVLLQADIIEWAQVAAMADAAFEALGQVDVLVNNVGDVAREQMSWRDIDET